MLDWRSNELRFEMNLFADLICSVRPRSGIKLFPLFYVLENKQARNQNAIQYVICLRSIERYVMRTVNSFAIEYILTNLVNFDQLVLERLMKVQ